MHKNNKLLLVAISVVLLAAGCNKTQPVKDLGTDDTNLEKVIQQAPTPPVASTTTKTVIPAKEPQVANLEVKYNGQEGKNALELIKLSYKVESKSFGSAGEFVESINGVKPDAQHFWKFFVNGKASSVGAGSYVTKSADVLEWKLDKIN